MAKINNDKQLAYWLQGFFEINGGADLSYKQIQTIVAAVGKVDQKGAVANFVLDTFAKTDQKDFGPAIAAHLEKVFKHDIDPSYDGDQTDFNDKHNGGFTPPRPGMRC